MTPPLPTDHSHIFFRKATTSARQIHSQRTAMSIPQQQQQAPPPPTSSVAAAAITDLTAIDADITTLLSTASSAIRCLSSIPPEKEREGAFVGHATTYHALLSSITARLRRQILQLQAAEIPVAVGTGGGSGGIDVGVLNSRNDVVGREMEAECWGAARTFLERRGGGEGVGEVRSRGLEEMEVDG